MLRVIVYRVPKNGRSLNVCEAMAEGIRRCGDLVDTAPHDEYQAPHYDVAVFYGLAGRCLDVFREYPAAGKKAVHIDLGYWGRTGDGGKRLGHHKIVVNGRHPTPYFQKRKHDASRVKWFDLKIEPWRRDGKHILLAGMGPKACGVEGYAPEQWERGALKQIQAVTDRPVIYRPKPSWKHAPEIAGAMFSDPRVEPDIGNVLKDCHAVVTHHSNAAVDGLVMGVPAFTIEGVALPMASDDLTKIEEPVRPDGRAQWTADIAWTQFNVAEMREGTPWRHLKDEGLI